MFPIIELSGNALNRGRQYGEAARERVRVSVANYARLFAHRRGIGWRQACDEACGYLPVIRAFSPQLVDEMRGVAQGAGMRFEEILALNVRTELIAGKGVGFHHPAREAALAQNSADGVPEFGECTTVAATGNATSAGHTLLAQTWDWSGDQRAACVVLRIAPDDGPRALTVTEGGILAKIGMNDAGVALALNILSSQTDGQPAGVPVHILLRHLLMQPNATATQRVFDGLKPAASSCITVAHAGGSAISYEITPQGIAALHPHEGVIAHTNHCVADATRAGECALPAVSSSKPRLNRAAQLLAQHNGAIDEQALMGVLRDESDGALSICRKGDPRLHPCDRMESVLGVVMNPNKGVMHVADNVPSMAQFEAVGI